MKYADRVWLDALMDRFADSLGPRVREAHRQDRIARAVADERARDRHRMDLLIGLRYGMGVVTPTSYVSVGGMG